MYKKVLRINPEDFVILARTGHAYMALEEEAKAVPLLRKAQKVIDSYEHVSDFRTKTALLTTRIDVHLYLAEALTLLGRFKEARGELRAILDMSDQEIREGYAIPIEPSHKRAKQMLNLIKER